MLDYSDEQKNKCCPKADCGCTGKKSSCLPGAVIQPVEKCCGCGIAYTQIPASLGDDSEGSEYAPRNGLFSCKIVEYEANGHVYLYSGDGIPVRISIGMKELEELVDNYFDNLDVQDEINNKLEQMVEDGTLEDIIEKYLTDEVSFIFPKLIPNAYSGDCNLIKTANKNILIDCDIPTNWSSVKTMLDNNDASHIDCLIISHYHSDHIGNVPNLINNGYVDAQTTVFLPAVPSQFTDILNTELDFKNMLNQAGIGFSTPQNNSIVTFDNVKIKFGNLDVAYMEANYTLYNWCSMTCLIMHKNVCALYNGDNGLKSNEYLYRTNFANRTVDLYKQGHHGIDYNAFVLFDEAIAPTFVVQSGGIEDYNKNNFLSPESSYLIANGSLYYPTFMQNDYIKFISNGNSMQCVSGKNFSTSGNRISADIYVDSQASTSDIQDGTSEHPFRELMQAITSIQNFPNSIVNIHLTDGTYGLGHEAPGTSTKNTIKIYLNPSIEVRILGNESDNTAVKISNVSVYSSYVKFYHLTINKDNDSINDKTGIYLFNSTAYLVDIKITSLTETKANYGIVNTEGSNLYLDSCTIEYAGTAIRNMRASILSFDSLTVNNCDTYIQNSEGICSDKNIMNQSTDSQVTLKEKFTYFDYLNIQYRDTNGHRQSVIIKNVSSSNSVAISVPYINSSGIVYEERALLTFNADNTITLSNKFEISYQNNSNVTVNTQSTGGIHIQQVWGCFNNS